MKRAPASCSLRTSSTQITPVVCTSVTRSRVALPDQSEVAVGVADPQPEHELDEAVVHPPDHRAHHAVGPAQLVALHHVDVVGRALHQQLELGGIELAVTVGVEDPLLRRRPNPESSAPP